MDTSGCHPSDRRDKSNQLWRPVRTRQEPAPSHGGSAQTLLVDALNIWVTNVIIFALWFWSTDRGGPPTCGLTKRAEADFLFPQMTLHDRELGNWIPGFIDYLFLAFTNATAFSPTDTLPLTARAKLLMMTEAMISLLTVALVAARAVNILA